jgi:hypothetical protein
MHATNALVAIYSGNYKSISKKICTRKVTGNSIAICENNLKLFPFSFLERDEKLNVYDGFYIAEIHQLFESNNLRIIRGGCKFLF